MKAAWLGRDQRDRIALFVGARGAGFSALRTEASVAGALSARDGTDWLEAAEARDEPERVMIVLTTSEPERESDYRSPAKPPPLEADEGWVVVRGDAPRVLVSRRKLDPSERAALLARDDCGALLCEHDVHACVRARTDAIFVYRRKGAAYVRVNASVARPLKAEELLVPIASLPLELSASPTICIDDDFDGSDDAVWVERSTPGLAKDEILINFVRNCFYTSWLGAGAAHYLFQWLPLSVAMALLLPVLVTFLQARRSSARKLAAQVVASTRVDAENTETPRVALDEEDDETELGRRRITERK